MTASEIRQELNLLEAQMQNMAVETVRLIAGIRIRLAMLEEALDAKDEQTEEQMS